MRERGWRRGRCMCCCGRARGPASANRVCLSRTPAARLRPSTHARAPALFFTAAPQRQSGGHCARESERERDARSDILGKRHDLPRGALGVLDPPAQVDNLLVADGVGDTVAAQEEEGPLGAWAGGGRRCVRGVSTRASQRTRKREARRTPQDALDNLGLGDDAHGLELSVPDGPRVGNDAAPPTLPKRVGDDARPARPEAFALGARVGVVCLGEAVRAAAGGRGEQGGRVAEVGDREGQERRGVVWVRVGHVERVQQRDGRCRARLGELVRVRDDVRVSLRGSRARFISRARTRHRISDGRTLRKASTATSSRAMPLCSTKASLSGRKRSKGPPRYRLRYPPRARYSSMTGAISVGEVESSRSRCSEEARYLDV